MHIYSRVLRNFMQQDLISSDDSILVVAGGNFDRQTMLAAGLTNVTISNLEPHQGHTDYSPYSWIRLDAENIELADASYDWVVVHAGLHHLAVPAKGVCEMFRVCRKGIICFEARDSLLMRLAVRSGLTSDYELEAPFIHGQSAGYRNGPIPNYVYRWTEREVEKVINSYAPTHSHGFQYFYGYRVPVQRFAMAKSRLYRGIGSLLEKLTRLLEFGIPRQGNQFGFCVRKNAAVKPWITEDLQYNHGYLSKMYDKDKYGSGTT